MKNYRLTVYTSEPNPTFKPREVFDHGYDGRAPNEREAELDVRTLEVMLTEDEYLAIKRAVLETFK